MKSRWSLFAVLLIALSAGAPSAAIAQQTPEPPPHASEKAATAGQQYSGMYSFLYEGEFVQLTVEDDGRVTGFVSRFEQLNGDKGAFLDQFFQSAKLNGNALIFTTKIVQGVSFDFKGTVERGEGKNPGDEAYFVLKGTLTQNLTDTSKKVTAHSSDVAFKMFPQEKK
jgi:hypothetical protein